MTRFDWLKYKARKLGVNPIDCANRSERLEIIRVLGRMGDTKTALDWWLARPGISHKAFMEALNGH